MRWGPLMILFLLLLLLSPGRNTQPSDVQGASSDPEAAQDRATCLRQMPPLHAFECDIR